MKYIILAMALLVAGCEVRVDSDNVEGDSSDISTGDNASVEQEQSWEEMTEEEKESELAKIDAGYYD